MANGFGTGGLSNVGQAATTAVGAANAARPPTIGGPDALGGPGPTAAQGPTPQPGGFSFGVPQAAGFGQSTGFGFGLTPEQTGLGEAQQGAGGFQPIPRTLSGSEIEALNVERRAQNLPPFDPRTIGAFNIRNLLGPLGFIADPTSFFRGQVPAIEANLNFQNLLQAQSDRQQAITLLAQQRDVIGQSPEALQALAVAQRRLEQPEPFTPEEVSQQQSAIRQRGAQGIESAQRQQLESLARQGVRGGVTAFQEAGQRQAGARQVSDELQRLAIQNALQRDINEAQAVDRLQGITGQNELRQIALNQALSELFTATRGEFDLSGLVAKERKSERGLLSKIGFF